MSRLDSFIRRMQAQRACLDWAAQAIQGRPGCVLELGLGNGRTYDHLRERLPDRDIYVFDRRISAHAGCIPPTEYMFLGEVAEMLPLAAARFGPAAVLRIPTSGLPTTGPMPRWRRWLVPCWLRSWRPVH